MWLQIQTSGSFEDGRLKNGSWVDGTVNPADWATKPRLVSELGIGSVKLLHNFCYKLTKCQISQGCNNVQGYQKGPNFILLLLKLYVQYC